MSDKTLNRILYAEDEPDIQAVAKLALESQGGFTVKICNNGLEALKIAPDFKPDLIILDVMMPGLDGPSTLAELRRCPDLAGTPVVFMSARVQRHEIEQYLAQGATAVIAKPFDPTTLAPQIRKIWDVSG
jgi:two-component system OmpR family response regulator